MAPIITRAAALLLTLLLLPSAPRPASARISPPAVGPGGGGRPPSDDGPATARPEATPRDLQSNDPKCRALGLLEWATLLQSEALGEFDVTQEAVGEAKSQGGQYGKTELLNEAEKMWTSHTDFERGRHQRIRSERSVPTPHVFCLESRGGIRQSGFRRRKVITDAIEAAIQSRREAGVDIVHDTVSFRPLFNGDDILCGYALVDSAVAPSVEYDGCVVHPMIMAMKLMPRTVSFIVEKVEQCEEEMRKKGGSGGGQQEQEGTGMEEDGSGADGTVLETLLEEAAEDVVVGCSAFENLTSPAVDVVLCPGSTAASVLDAALESQSRRPISDEMNAWVMSMVGSSGEGGGGGPTISDHVYWTSTLEGGGAAAPSSGGGTEGGTSSRGELWRGVLNDTEATGRCGADHYGSRLDWSVLDGGRDDDFAAVRVVYDAAFAEEWEKRCALVLLAAIAVHPDVCALEVTPEHEVSNDQAQWLMQSGVKDETPFFDVGLHGEGQLVALSDTGIDLGNCYFHDAQNDKPTQELDFYGHRKIVQYWPKANDHDGPVGHGTHTAGTIAGSRAPDGINEEPGIADGVAPAAKIAFMDIGFDDGSLIPASPDLLTVGRNPATESTDSSPIAHIHSMSWGSKMHTYYNNQARTFDNYIFDNDDFLIVIAAGNQGRWDKATSLATPAMAKNVLTVGATHSYGTDLAEGQLGPSYIADFSSRGPTEDGRMKPDLVAPGKSLLSTAARPDNPGACDPPNGELPTPLNGNLDGVAYKDGTSMATPAVAGTAALVRQYFEEGWYVDGTKNSGPPRSISGAMVKAILMNGAQTSNMNGVDNGSKGVTPVKPYDNTIGFGRVSLSNSLYIAGKTDVQVKFWDREMISDGEKARTYDISIDKSNGCTGNQLGVTLVWAEGGATPGCTKCLLSDMSMQITKKGEDFIYYPNGRSSKDSDNNVERIVVDGVADGDTFTVEVDAYNLMAMTQVYALVATGCFGGIANELDTTGMNVYSMDHATYSASGNSSTTMILIIVFSVLGGLLLCCIGFACIRRKRSTGK